MIAIDTCVVIDFLEGDEGPHVEALAELLASHTAVLAPSTVTELLSDPKGGRDTAGFISGLDQLPLDDGYWERAGATRATVLRAGRKAALGDVLIAQACIDAGVALLTRDADFTAFVPAGLKLA